MFTICSPREKRLTTKKLKALLTMVARGGIEPPTRGFSGNVPIWVNAEVMNCERIILGGGNRSSKILMSPEGLLQVPNTEVIAHLGYLA